MQNAEAFVPPYPLLCPHPRKSPCTLQTKQSELHLSKKNPPSALASPTLANLPPGAVPLSVSQWKGEGARAFSARIRHRVVSAAGATAAVLELLRCLSRCVLSTRALAHRYLNRCNRCSIFSCSNQDSLSLSLSLSRPLFSLAARDVRVYSDIPARSCRTAEDATRQRQKANRAQAPRLCDWRCSSRHLHSFPFLPGGPDTSGCCTLQHLVCEPGRPSRFEWDASLRCQFLAFVVATHVADAQP